MNSLFNGISYMQDMTSTICSNATENDSKQLIDERDGKKYWVTKLKDNNCWMTQNLDYDLSGVASTSPAQWQNVEDIVQWYDAGEYVYTTPTNANQDCGDVNGLQNCTSKGWQLVDDSWRAATEPNYSEVIDMTNKIYNAHYLSGNYYSWGATTSGICPNRWEVPANGKYDALFKSYGANSGLKYGDQDIRLYPLSFVYGGRVRNGSLINAGSSGYYWSSSSGSSTNAYAMDFNGNGISSSYGHNRYYGFSVRCVAR